VENFTPESLFGLGKPPNCYLWVDRRVLEEKTNKDLLNIVRDKEELKDFVAKGKGGYILKKDLRKYLNEEYDIFINGAPLQEIADFIEKVYYVIKDCKI